MMLLTEDCTDERRPREAVRWFAERMEETLKKNDHKRGWTRMSFGEISRRIHQELRELVGVLRFYRMRRHNRAWSNLRRAEALEDVIREATDVANFSMMLADNARRELSELLDDFNQ